MKVCFIGHITRDRMRLGAGPEFVQPGGAAWYGALVAAELGARVFVVTRLDPRDQEQLTVSLRRADIEIDIRPSESTTEFWNHYSADLSGNRKQRLESVAAPFEPGDHPQGADSYVFGPLTRADMSPGCLAAVGDRRRVALDVQGLVRSCHRGPVVESGNPDIAEFVRASSVVKASRREAMLASGLASATAAAEWFMELGVDEVMITEGARGSTIATTGGMHTLAALDVGEAIDPTGCGDSYLAAYLVGRLCGNDPLR